MDLNVRLFLPDELDIYNFGEALDTSIDNISSPFSIIAQNISKGITGIIQWPTYIAALAYMVLFIKSIIGFSSEPGLSDFLGIIGHVLGVIFCILLIVLIRKNKKSNDKNE